MDSTERKAFWDALCNLKDIATEHVQTMFATIRTPKYLCRYRSVSESSLLQLQENKLYYSSADYYDDPFDTFIHVDYANLIKLLELLRNALNSNDPNLLNAFKTVEPRMGISAEVFYAILKNNPFNVSSLPDRIKRIRTIIQKQLFSICFCENVLNETLWLKYANNYKGFALVYDIKDENTFLCGKEEKCQNCRSLIEKPSVYPVYYSEEAFDATKFALASMLWDAKVPAQIMQLSREMVVWDAERVSLIKKKCHEYDQEWRMIRPTMMPDRTCIKMKPKKIILGLRMPEYERLLVISAAKIAGICNIEELYIDETDQLSSREIVRS